MMSESDHAIAAVESDVLIVAEAMGVGVAVEVTFWGES